MVSAPQTCPNAPAWTPALPKAPNFPYILQGQLLALHNTSGKVILNFLSRSSQKTANHVTGSLFLGLYLDIMSCRGYGHEKLTMRGICVMILLKMAIKWLRNGWSMSEMLCNVWKNVEMLWIVQNPKTHQTIRWKVTKNSAMEWNIMKYIAKKKKNTMLREINFFVSYHKIPKKKWTKDSQSRIQKCRNTVENKLPWRERVEKVHNPSCNPMPLPHEQPAPHTPRPPPLLRKKEKHPKNTRERAKKHEMRPGREMPRESTAKGAKDLPTLLYPITATFLFFGGMAGAQRSIYSLKTPRALQPQPQEDKMAEGKGETEINGR